MGWERKRGKLHELEPPAAGRHRHQLGVPVGGVLPRVPADVRYVIMLDADTRLPRDAALRPIGKIAHPLNCPASTRRCSGSSAATRSSSPG